MNIAAIPLPREANAILGHNMAERVLLDAWNSGRMPHAWLFSGPRGIGKATMAYRFARFVLASRGVDTGTNLFSDPVGEAAKSMDVDPSCPISLQVKNGGHPDLLTIERSINPQTKQLRRDIVVQDVSALSVFLRLTAANGGWRVVVIDSVDEMNRHAANAVLKLLEEPPNRALLILVSHAPGSLLPTIRSRCRKLHTSALTDADVGALLNQFTDDIDPETASAAIRLAEGSVGRALQIVASGGPEILRHAVRLISSTGNLDQQSLHKMAEKWIRRGKGEQGNNLQERLELLLWWITQGVRRKAVGKKSSEETVLGEVRMFDGLVARNGLDGCCARIQKAENILRRGIGLNLDRKQIVLSVMQALAG